MSKFIHLHKNQKNRIKNMQEKIMEDKVVIAFATDHNFRYYTGIALFSLMEHAAPDTQYEILILSESLSAVDCALFTRLIEVKKNFSLRFVDVSEKIREIDIKKTTLRDLRHCRAVSSLYA